MPLAAGVIAAIVAMRSPSIKKAVEQSEIIQSAIPAGRDVVLFFADPRWTRLTSELRNIPVPRDKIELIKVLERELAAGPRQSGARILPEGLSLRNAYLGADGLAILDFDASLESFDPGGASGEFLTVNALVQTITENVEGIEKVQLLINGKEKETLAGHINISGSITPDPFLRDSGSIDVDAGDKAAE